MKSSPGAIYVEWRGVIPLKSWKCQLHQLPPSRTDPFSHCESESQLWKWKSIASGSISKTDPFSRCYSEMSIVKVNCEQQCGDILVIKHTETASEFSFIKSVEWLNNWSWQMEVGTVALQMRNSSATELTSVTLEHRKSQSAQIFKIYKISRWYFKNIAIAQKHNSRWEASRWWKMIQLLTKWCFKKCLCVATFNFCWNNCSSTFFV